MNKRWITAVCVLLIAFLAVPVRAETVLTEQWIEFSLTSLTEGRNAGDTRISWRGAGFESAVFRIENVEGRDAILVAEYEGALPAPEDWEEYVIPQGDYPYSEYLVTVEWQVGGEALKYSVNVFSPDSFHTGAGGSGADPAPPNVTISPVAERMLVNAADEGGIFAVGQDLVYLDLSRSFGGLYDPYRGGKKQIALVSDPVPYNGDWVYTCTVYDTAGNSMSRTVFLHTSGIEDMPDAILNEPKAAPQETAPNTADPGTMLPIAAGTSAVLALLALHRAKSRKGSR